VKTFENVHLKCTPGSPVFRFLNVPLLVRMLCITWLQCGTMKYVQASVHQMDVGVQLIINVCPVLTSLSMVNAACRHVTPCLISTSQAAGRVHTVILNVTDAPTRSVPFIIITSARRLYCDPSCLLTSTPLC